MKFLPRKNSARISILVLLILFLLGVYYMYMQKYQMYVRVTSYDENSSEFPSKKVWFDASEWLSTSQYIKVSDFFLINKKFNPIEPINSIEVLKALKIIRPIRSAIDDSKYTFPEIHALKNMNGIEFIELMKEGISYEYIYTQFDEESLKPNQDLFLIRFIHNEKKYELLIARKLYNNEYTYDKLSFLYKENEWHKRNKDILTYRDYLEGKIDSYK
ncbi:hypothetical protein KKI93_05555 [Xenorhabdus bovienii]|uniref:hypothetical protein n=1 Tax=Xenorhabdus bovienii TaxID=40576 RepID=UPI0023B3427A|nr:hypothetical protein [Xenorhabdus bovienii]MDE9563544.1 hypothetical protein [Xenorhabdus bovienii]